MSWDQIFITAIVWGIPLILAITLHEAGHAFVAKKLGDPTADNEGRVTLNPIKHIDPIGTIALPALLYFMKAPFLFGFAKPVPIRYDKLGTLPRDIALVAAAGPAANVILIILSALAFNLSALVPTGLQESFTKMIMISIGINTVLAIFNLLPIPPLDGSKILMTVSPRPIASAIFRMERFGIFLVLGLLFLMPLFASAFGYNPLAVMIEESLKGVFAIVEPLMRLECLFERSVACGNAV